MVCGLRGYDLRREKSVGRGGPKKSAERTQFQVVRRTGPVSARDSRQAGPSRDREDGRETGTPLVGT